MPESGIQLKDKREKIQRAISDGLRKIKKRKKKKKKKRKKKKKKKKTKKKKKKKKITKEILNDATWRKICRPANVTSQGGGTEEDKKDREGMAIIVARPTTVRSRFSRQTEIS